MAKEKTSYENAVKRRVGKTVIESLLNRSNQEKQQRETIERAYLGPDFDYENTSKELRSEIAAVMQQDSDIGGEKILKKNLENFERETKETKDLEAIIDSAPLEVLSESLFLVNYNKGNVHNNKLKDYHVLLNTQYEISKTAEAVKKGEKREKDLEKLQNKARKLAMERFKKENSDIKDKYTQDFIREFADAVAISDNEVSVKYSLNKYAEYIKEARDYVNDEKKDSELRKYIKTDIAKDDLPVLYDVITRSNVQTD